MKWLAKAKIRKWTQDAERNPQDYETIVAIGAAYGMLADYVTSIEYYKRAIAISVSTSQIPDVCF